MRRQLTVKRDDEGSILYAVVIVMILTMTLASMLLFVESGVNKARVDQSRTNAFQFANAGIDQALYRLDRKDLPTSTQNTSTGRFEVLGTNATGVSRFRETFRDGTDEFVIEAQQQPEGQTAFWKVRATGTDTSGRKRQAIATATAVPLVINGFFTINRFDLRGAQADTPKAYRSSSCIDPTTMTNEHCNLNPIPGWMATNSDVLLSDSTADDILSRIEGFRMYGRATQREAEENCRVVGGSRSDRCHMFTKVEAVTERLKTVVPDNEGIGCFPQAPDGRLGRDGQTTVVAPGDYWCPELHVRGRIDVGPAVAGRTDVRVWIDRNFTMAGTGSNRAVVNKANYPRRFQVYFPMQCGARPCTKTEQEQELGQPSATSTICKSEFWGLLYTPGLKIDCGGSSQPRIFGAVVANLHNSGGNHFNFTWDVDLVSQLHNEHFVIKGWRECPARLTDC
ncbi:MAG TPA: hypothetical protein VM345_01280 [Acidimicrobiales bacterium]|jgi:hypothetical protein|nr:hypothetical protein [Acidimicrobiales bacterium]